ncbi:MAG: DNA repair protein RecO [Deltaproteobacteria bacterium]
MNLIKTQGIVVGEKAAGEADKILTIFTQKHGMIKAAVKGAYRPKSSMIASSQFLVFSDFILYKGKDLYRLSSCEVIEPFYNIRNDIIKLTYASYAVELIKEVIHENMQSYRALQLFLNTLHAISNSGKSLEMIIRAYELRLMCLCGYKPQIDICASCGKNSDKKYFSFSHNGLICEECGQNKKDVVSVSEPTVSTIKYIIKAEVKKLFSFSVSQMVLKELKLINEIFIKEKLEKEFKSLKLLEKI